MPLETVRTFGCALAHLLNLGCDIDQGIDAYYVQAYHKAARLLAPSADRFSKYEPSFRFWIFNRKDFKEMCQDLDPPLLKKYEEQLYFKESTALYYEIWMAYSGSLFADPIQDRDLEGCKAIQTALRQVTFHITGCTFHLYRSPWEGDYWPRGVEMMRRHWDSFDCEEKLKENGELLEDLTDPTQDPEIEPKTYLEINAIP